MELKKEKNVRDQRRSDLGENNPEFGGGHIRNYVLFPYLLCKDMR